MEIDAPPADPADMDTLAAELALGLLESDDRVLALRRVIAEPDFARRVEQWRDHFAALVAEIPEVSAPDGLARIERTLFGGSVVRRWRAAAITATLVAASLALVIAIRPASTVVPSAQPSAATAIRPLVAALARSPDRPALPALFDVASHEIRIGGASLAGDGNSAELWVIPADGKPRSVGLLLNGVPTVIRVTTRDYAAIGDGVTLAISIEPHGGSPSGAPTGPIVASGSLTET